MSVDKALEFYKDGKYNEAIDAFTAVLEIEGDNAELYNNIGLCYANLDDDEKAEKFYLKALQLNPKLAQIYINLADIYYKQKDMAKGIDLMTGGICELPDNMVFRHYLARFYMEDAKLDLAIDELTDLIWRNLNQDNKVSLFVRYIDIATGETETRIVNKNL